LVVRRRKGVIKIVVRETVCVIRGAVEEVHVLGTRIYRSASSNRSPYVTPASNLPVGNDSLLTGTRAKVVSDGLTTGVRGADIGSCKPNSGRPDLQLVVIIPRQTVNQYQSVIQCGIVGRQYPL